jgi:hypothetical protein
VSSDSLRRKKTVLTGHLAGPCRPDNQPPAQELLRDQRTGTVIKGALMTRLNTSRPPHEQFRIIFPCFGMLPGDDSFH